MNMETLTINDELKQLIPPLSADERKQLEANIIAEGCRDPLVVWNVPPEQEEEYLDHESMSDDEILDGVRHFGFCEIVWRNENFAFVSCSNRNATEEYDRSFDGWVCAKTGEIVDGFEIIIDGHNRYEICKANGIEFETTGMCFADIDAVKVWMIDNQKGRRNLTDGWKYELAQARKALLLEKGREKLSEAGTKHIGNQHSKVEPLSKVDKPSSKHNTQKEIATDLGWSTGKVAMADKVWKDAKPEVKEKVKAGEISINEAYREIKKPNVHVSNNSGENEWYTPKPIIEQARQVLGSIELDPASSDKAQEVVQAKQYFTKHNSGLNKQWQGKLWMNPPYAQPLISQFATKLVESVKSGSVTEGIVLVNNATETAWFQQMLAEASAVCFIKGRLKFIDAQGNPSGAPLQGQALLYFGGNVRGFRSAFAQTGICLVK